MLKGHRSFLNSIASLDGWIQLYKFAIMFTWFYQATIELAPNYDAVITSAISRFLAIQRQTNPTWALEEHKIMLWVSNTNAVEMDTQLTDSSDFRKKFNVMVSNTFRGVQVLINNTGYRLRRIFP